LFPSVFALMFFEYKLHSVTPSILSCGSAIGFKFIPDECKVPTVITYQNGVTACVCFWNLLDVTRLNRSAYRQLLKQTESAILGVMVL